MNTKRYVRRLIFALLVAFGGLAAVIVTDTTPKLGLDLEGGISVILTAEGEGATQEGVLNQTVEVIRQRIDALGVAEPEVSTSGESDIFIQLPGVADEDRALELIGTTAQLTFREVKKTTPASTKDAPEVTKETGSEVQDEPVVYPGEDDPETLYELAPARLTGDVVTEAEAAVDPTTGSQWFVSLSMNDEGSEEWEEFTSEQACQRDEGKLDQIAIVLDDSVVAAPGMQAPGGGQGGVECGQGITGGDSQIDAGGQEEAKDLALVLRYGSLPVELEQQQVQKVSPTLGEDSLKAGITAGVLGLILVLIYVFLYYRALGLIIFAGLLVFTSIFYTIMAVLGETAGLSLSLAGVAGMIISIGVTTDSYIVAFERLKDEVRAGKSMRAAVDRGMVRSFQTIIVADVVTGLAAVILFFLAVGPVRGFALTLGLATLIDVFVAYFFTRSAVQLLARSRVFASASFIGLKKALGAEA
jgi:protein-export membrane protein SecD